MPEAVADNFTLLTGLMVPVASTIIPISERLTFPSV